MTEVNGVPKNARRKFKEKLDAESELEDAHNRILGTIFGDINNVGRRSDIGKRSLCLKDNDNSIIDADDEKEKRERKEKEKAEKEKEKKHAEIKKTGINILNKLSQAELDEHYSKCIQLCNQNKVSVKNAFKLQLIDYMKLICMKQPSKTENLTLMGCTLGASAKIYAHRVDKVYTDMVKIVSGKELEVEKGDSDEGNEENALNGINDGNNETPKRRKRKDSSESVSDKKNINLKEIDFDKMLLPLSGLEKKKSENQPQEKPTLPVGIDYFLDCPVQEVDCRISLNPITFATYDISSTNNLVFFNESHYSADFEILDPSAYIKEYKELHKYFNLLGERDNEELLDSSLAFDPSSQTDFPDSIRIDAGDPDANCYEGVAQTPECLGIDYDDECLPEPELNLNYNKSGQISVNQPRSFSAPSMAKLVSSKSNDYSFFDNSLLDFWAGPIHWSIKKVKDREKEQRSGGDTHKKTAKKNFNIDFNFENFKDIKRLYADIDSSTLARKTMLTWSKSRCRFPQDILFTQKILFSLLKNTELLIVKKNSKTKLLCSAALNENEEETVLTPDDFSGDISHVEDERDDNLDDHCNEEFKPDISESISPLRDDEEDHAPNSNFELLPAPPKVNKVTINYAKVQKRIDVKLIKKTIWDSMALEGLPKVETHKNPVKFSDVFKNLPDKLPKEEAAELSYPIAFMALLHMANEKNLFLKGTDNHDDIYVSLD